MLLHRRVVDWQSLQLMRLDGSLVNVDGGFYMMPGWYHVLQAKSAPRGLGRNANPNLISTTRMDFYQPPLLIRV